MHINRIYSPFELDEKMFVSTCDCIGPSYIDIN